jgi:hypothetical protein
MLIGENCLNLMTWTRALILVFVVQRSRPDRSVFGENYCVIRIVRMQLCTIKATFVQSIVAVFGQYIEISSCCFIDVFPYSAFHCLVGDRVHEDRIFLAARTTFRFADLSV